MNIDIQLEKYWEIFTRQLSIEEQHKLEELLEEDISEFQDATEKRSLKHDSEATYSGCYKHSGYKMDATIDADLLFPLYYYLMGNH